jgi:hypothetical protein
MMIKLQSLMVSAVHRPSEELVLSCPVGGSDLPDLLSSNYHCHRAPSPQFSFRRSRDHSHARDNLECRYLITLLGNIRLSEVSPGYWFGDEIDPG